MYMYRGFLYLVTPLFLVRDWRQNFYTKKIQLKGVIIDDKSWSLYSQKFRVGDLEWSTSDSSQGKQWLFYLKNSTIGTWYNIYWYDCTVARFSNNNRRLSSMYNVSASLIPTRFFWVKYDSVSCPPYNHCYITRNVVKCLNDICQK